MVLINRFHPYSLPYTSNRSIPYTTRVSNLLSSWLIPFICRVPNFNDQLIVPFRRQSFCNIKRERSKSTCMNTHLNTIHPYISLPVNSSKMQQDILSFPFRWYRKRSFIYKFLIFVYSFCYTRKRRLYCKWNQYISIHHLWNYVTLINDCIFPKPIKVLPLVTLHNRTWIFW